MIMMNTPYHLTDAEWYHARKYVAPPMSAYTQSGTQTSLDLYPGHAAYSGIQWHLDPLDPKETPTSPETGLFSGSPRQNAGDSDLVDDLLANKVEAMRQNIEHIQYQLDKRGQLRTQNLNGIDLNMMQCQTELFQCDLWPPVSNNLIEKRRSQLERELQGLEQEKRAEETMSWRDHQMLLRELREATTDYEGAIRRKGLLADPNTTGPTHESGEKR